MTTDAQRRGARNRARGADAERQAQRLLEQLTGREVIRLRARVGTDGKTDDRADLIVLTDAPIGIEVKSASAVGRITEQLRVGVDQMRAQQRRSRMMHRAVMLRAPGGVWLVAADWGENPTLTTCATVSSIANKDVMAILIAENVVVMTSVRSTRVAVMSPETWWDRL